MILITAPSTICRMFIRTGMSGLFRGLLLSFLITLPSLADNPVSLQLFARDNDNKCRIPYEKEVSGGGTVQLQIYAGGALQETLSGDVAGNVHSFNIEIDAGLVEYKLELVQNGNVLETADSVLCGDAFIVTGQSNAGAKRCNDNTSEWIRSFGSSEWAVSKSNSDENGPSAGCWGWDIARRIVEAYQIPVFMINRAKGGTQVVQHLRNDAMPGDTTTFFGELLTHVTRAGLKDKVKAVFWHQGENDAALSDQEVYIANFGTLVADWRGEYSNLKKVYLFQIKPSCYHSHVVLLDAQRQIPHFLPDVHVMSTLGTEENLVDLAGDNCHFTNDVYERWGERMFRLAARDLYGEIFDQPVSAPDILQAAYTSGAKDEIVLQFDQDVVWEDSLEPGRSDWIDNLISQVGMQYLKDRIFLDDQDSVVQSVSVSGNTVTLQLKQAGNATSVSFLREPKYTDGPWYSYPLIWGANGVAALSFYEVPLKDAPDINLDQAPFILSQPGNKLTEAGLTVTFRAVASGSDLTYQWMKNGQHITGATSAYYTTPALTVDDDGSEISYTVTNNLGTAASESTLLYVKAKVPAPEFSLTSQYGRDPTWNAGEPLTVTAVVTNRDAIAALPEPWNKLNYWYFIRDGENRFLNQEEIDSITFVVYDARRTNENNPPLNREGEYDLTFCIDNIVYRVCHDMHLTVDTSAEVVSLQGTGKGPDIPVILQGDYLKWNRAGRVKIWSLDGRLLFEAKGRKGEKMQLSPDISQKLSATRVLISIEQM